MQIEMWERITAGLASLGDQAVAGDSRESLPSDHLMDEQQLVEYEGMLVAASAAQRRRYQRCLLTLGDDTSTVKCSTFGQDSSLCPSS